MNQETRHALLIRDNAVHAPQSAPKLRQPRRVLVDGVSS